MLPLKINDPVISWLHSLTMINITDDQSYRIFWRLFQPHLKNNLKGHMTSCIFALSQLSLSFKFYRLPSISQGFSVEGPRVWIPIAHSLPSLTTLWKYVHVLHWQVKQARQACMSAQAVYLLLVALPIPVGAVMSTIYGCKSGIRHFVSPCHHLQLCRYK